MEKGGKNSHKKKVVSQKGVMRKENLVILGISGGGGKESRSSRIITGILTLLKKRGVEVDLLLLHELNLPLFLPDRKPSPKISRIKRRTLKASAYVVATPEYHGGMSSLLKNFFDHHYEEFRGKLFGLAVSTTRGLGSSVIDQLVTVIHHCHGWTLPYSVAVSDQDIQEDGSFSPAIMERLRRMSDDLYRFALLFRGAKSETS
jgi:FMN reductase